MKISEYLESIGACDPAIEWVGDRNAEQAIQDCHRGDWLLWIAQKIGVNERALTLAKARCAETVIHLMKDQRSIDAVNTAIKYGNGEINMKELTDAAAAAYAATYTAAATDAAAYTAAYAAAYTADAYADAADAAAHTAAAYTAAAYATYTAAATDAAAYTAAYAAAENKLKTANICREILGQEILFILNSKI